MKNNIYINTIINNDYFIILNNKNIELFKVSKKANNLKDLKSVLESQYKVNVLTI